MKKLPLAGTAILLSAAAAPVLAADLPAFAPPPVPIFSWTSCFMGAHIGGAWDQGSLTDPAALVENSILGTVVTPGNSVGVNSSGLIVGGHVGCDYQFGFSPWVVGAEGAVSGANLRGSTNFALPLGGPNDIATNTAKTDFLPSVTARLGYALGNWLFYARGRHLGRQQIQHYRQVRAYRDALWLRGGRQPLRLDRRRRRGMGVCASVVGAPRVRLPRPWPS